MTSAETSVRRRGRAHRTRVIGAWALFALGATVFGFLVWAHAVYQADRDAAMREGVTVLVTRPTINLAFFDARGLDDFTTAAPEIDRWFVGGHSLGGVRACLMAESALDTRDDLAGLVLLGSYCANDLSETYLSVVSVAAENDGLSTPATFESRSGLLPASAVFTTIEGANHASFGDYGPQSGDGERTLSSDNMRAQLTAALAAVLATANTEPAG